MAPFLQTTFENFIKGEISLMFSTLLNDNILFQRIAKKVSHRFIVGKGSFG